jgi:hypothetical protein
MKTYPIQFQLLQRIVNYLEQQPWGQVNHLLQEIGEVARAVDDLPQSKENGKDVQPMVQ